jgi:hypothetical protein
MIADGGEATDLAGLQRGNAPAFQHTEPAGDQLERIFVAEVAVLQRILRGDGHSGLNRLVGQHSIVLPHGGVNGAAEI